VHVLTKIFIVLVALLAVMLVPLVVVYAKNESSYKVKYTNTETQRAAAEASLAKAQQNFASEQAALQSEIDRLRSEIGDLRSNLAEKDGRIAALQSDLTTERTTNSQIASEVKVISSTLASGQTLIERLVSESDQLRQEALRLARANAELEESVREQGRQLEVAEAAVRALEERVQRLSEAEAAAVRRVAMYEERFGEIGDAAAGGLPEGYEPIDREVLARIVDVRDANGVMLAEINAGQRDGVKKGWVMTISDGEGNYIGRLRIIDVDVNRATGIAENAKGEPIVTRVGHRAYALPNT